MEVGLLVGLGSLPMRPLINHLRGSVQDQRPEIRVRFHDSYGKNILFNLLLLDIFWNPAYIDQPGVFVTWKVHTLCIAGYPPAS